MSTLTIRMTPEVEEILGQFMQERGLTDRSEAICFVLKEALREDEITEERSKNARIEARRRDPESMPPRLRCSHDTWD